MWKGREATEEPACEGSTQIGRSQVLRSVVEGAVSAVLGLGIAPPRTDGRESDVVVVVVEMQENERVVQLELMLQMN